MAVLCLAADLTDLQARLGRIVVARSRSGESITAGDLQADGAMAALLREAIQPNLVQTLEGNPVLVHGGPVAQPEDAEFILKNTANTHGFYGASSMERLPTEVALTEQTRRFKAIQGRKTA